MSLGFQKDDAGKHTMHFPRITVRIDGEDLDLLFDTGATTQLTPAALAALARRLRDRAERDRAARDGAQHPHAPMPSGATARPDDPEGQP